MLVICVSFYYSEILGQNMFLLLFCDYYVLYTSSRPNLCF